MEDGGVGADTERQAKNRHGEEPRLQPNQAGGVAQILSQCLKKTDGVPAMRGLFGGGDIAELAPCSKGGFPGIHPQRDIFIDFVLQVSFDFLREIPIALAPLEISKPAHNSLDSRAQHAANSIHNLVPAAALLGQLLSSG